MVGKIDKNGKLFIKRTRNGEIDKEYIQMKCPFNDMSFCGDNCPFFVGPLNLICRPYVIQLICKDKQLDFDYFCDERRNK